jgi:hypothetical protein
VGDDRFGGCDHRGTVGGLALARSHLAALLVGDADGATGVFVFSLVGWGCVAPP